MHELTAGRAGSLGREATVGRYGRDIASVLGFAVLIALSAQVKFFMPNSAVPVTLQTAAVLLCGFWLRPAMAVAATVSYLVLGFAAGRFAPEAPFFAAFQLGVTTITGGYLFGFVVAAGAVSTVSRAVGRLTLGRSLAVGFVGTAVIFLCGVTWIALIAGSVDKAIQVGLVPFVGVAVVKIALVASLVQVGRAVRS